MAKTEAKKSGITFKDTYGASSEFKGGMVDPSTLMIVGVDLEVEDWNEDLHDADRLIHTLEFLKSHEAEFGIEAMGRFGCADQIIVTRRRGQTLVVDGRTKTLVAREVNRRRLAAKNPLVLEVPIVIDKTDDQSVTMRLTNAFRRDDPPWVKAGQAAQMKRQGKSPKDIMLLSGGVDQSTLNNWERYRQCVPEVKRLVEYPEPGQARVPFNVASLIGGIGAGETKRQLLALEVLKNTGAQLTGESGRINAKNVVKAIVEGTITEAPPPALEPLESGRTSSTSPNYTAPGVSDMGDHGDNHPESQRKPRNTTPPLVGIAGKMSPSQIRQVTKAFEGIKDKSEAECLIFAALAIVTGLDPNVQFLQAHPRAQEAFQEAMGIKVAGDRPCTNKHCDRGHDTKRKDTCSKCGGHGKIKSKGA